MKKLFLLFLILWLLLFTIPLFTLDKTAEIQDDGSITASSEMSSQSGEAQAAGDAKSIDSQTTVTLLDNGKVTELPLDEYLAGVVAAEMPALFPEEALKAQAVAARTYTMNKMSSTPPAVHKGAALCSNPAHCKAYKPLSVVASNWGVSRDVYTDKILSAVHDTDGEILLYENQPIKAVFHSTSSGKTERAADVWGKDVPYLQSVASAGEEESPRYESRVEMTPEEFQKKFSVQYANAKLDSDPSKWFQKIKRSEAGGVMTLSVGGVETTGSTIRNMCSLRSTNFTVRVENGMLVFETKGYGHGVGMSQYGARALAAQGKNYREILTWYYKGVKLGKINIPK